MSKSTLITASLCVALSVVSIGWLVSGEPMPVSVSERTGNSSQKLSDETKNKERIFKVGAPKATALNDEPVNIIIESGIASNPIPVNPGPADLIVSSSILRMRSEPSSRSQTLNQYKRGARFSFIRDKKGWVLVQSLDDGQKGWMFRKYMKAGG